MHPVNTPAVSNSQANINARHAEVARRYAWAAQQRRKGGHAEKASPARLLTLIRLREIERLCQWR